MQMHSNFGSVCKGKTLLMLWVFFCMVFCAVKPQSTDDGNISPCELESIINQLTHPRPEYQLHVSALRSQLKNLLRSSQTPTTNQLNSDDYDFTGEDKRSIASLASVGQGYLNRPFAYVPKRSLATLAKNGQLPTPEPEEVEQINTQWEQKKNLGSVVRQGGMRYGGKRNIGTLARDYQLPSTGKRNLATLARLGLLSSGSSSNNNPKRNLAALARYNSGFRSGEKRNLGALKGSPVHGNHQKKDNFEQEALADIIQRDIMDYAEQSNGLYPIYDDYLDIEKRFLETHLDTLVSYFSRVSIFKFNFFSNLVPYAQAATASQLDSIDNHNPGEENTDASAKKSDSSSDSLTLPISEWKRHIGALARSGWLPAGLRPVRSGRFSRSGRARQKVEFYHQPERLRQPTAAVCRRCFVPYKPMASWGGHGLQITTWGTPPRITAQYRRSFRRPATYRF